MNKLAVNKINLFSYSIMAFPLAFTGIPLYIHAPDFYSSTLGLPLTTIGTMLLLLRLVDAVQDPLIGYFSDKYSGHRKSIFLLGVIFLGSGFLGLFNPPEQNLLLWFAANIFIATTGFSILTINLNTLGGIWSDDYNQKTKISGTREALGLLGLIFAATLPTYLILNFGGKQGFQFYSIVMLLSLVLAAFIFIKLWLSKFKEINQSKNKISYREVKIAIGKNKRFFSVYFISVLASSIPAVLIIFYVRDRLNLEGYLGLFLILYFLAGALSMPIWQKISGNSNKISAWKKSMVLAIIAFIWAFFLREGDLYQFALICIVSGFAFGGELALPPAILADSVNKKSATTEYSILTFLMKASLAISVGVIFPLLEMQGYKSGGDNSESSLWYLGFYYAFVPCFIKIIAVILLSKFLKTEGVKYEKNSNNNGGLYVSS